MIEFVGIVATLLILVSMLFKTTTIKGSILMRVINVIGSVIFTIYGCLLPAISTAILNAALVLVNSYHLVFLFKDLKKEKSKQESEQDLSEENKAEIVAADENNNN